MFTVKSIGARFVDYYRSLGYHELQSSSLLSEKLPMSFVMSAGMVQFEELAGKERHGDHFVLIQNCFRHFDLNRVGGSDFHLSLFQMPGAFDFGPIDRRETVRRIWDLVVGELGFDPKKLVATYFKGGKVGRWTFAGDIETAEAWKELGLAPERIIGLDGKNNFWKQSDQMVGIVNSRKCGPTTEIFYDRGEEWGCGPDCLPGCACGRFVEFMNNIFITYGIGENEKILPLPEPFVETVIGRERAAAISQGVSSVYEVDNILPLVQQARCFAKPEVLAPAEQHRYEQILVDHLRALLFLARDGAPAPGRGGRARLMRILVREFLTSQRLLGINPNGFMRTMLLRFRDFYPELETAEDTVLDWLDAEETVFKKTLQRELHRFEQKMMRSHSARISGKDILYYEKERGVPLSLMAFILRQRHIEYDLAEYQAALAQFQQGTLRFDQESPQA